VQHRITVDLGPLLPRLQAHCRDHGVRASDTVREAVARLLGVQAPEMDGHTANLWQNSGKPHPRLKNHSGGNTTSES